MRRRHRRQLVDGERNLRVEVEVIVGALVVEAKIVLVQRVCAKLAAGGVGTIVIGGGVEQVVVPGGALRAVRGLVVGAVVKKREVGVIAVVVDRGVRAEQWLVGGASPGGRRWAVAVAGVVGSTVIAEACRATAAAALASATAAAAMRAAFLTAAASQRCWRDVRVLCWARRSAPMRRGVCLDCTGDCTVAEETC